MNKVEKFKEFISQMSDKIAFTSYDAVALLHHNDSDGISSGGILYKSLYRMGIQPHRFCLEKTYPQAIAEIANSFCPEGKGLVVITDFGSGIIEEIREAVPREHHILLLDHHELSTSDALENTSIINCRAHGVSGDSEASAATICAFFSLALSPLNKDLASLGLLGAFGDSHFNSAENMAGLTEELGDFCKNEESFLPESLEITVPSGKTAALSALKSEVDALGSFLYYEGGPDEALAGLLEGYEEILSKKAEDIRHIFLSELESFMKNNEILKRECTAFFHLKGPLAEMGVKTVGLVCEALSKTYLDESFFIIGAQPVKDQIPGLGALQLGQTKLSFRVTEMARRNIEEGKLPPISEIIPPLAAEFSGLADGCHSFAGAATLSPDAVEDFASACEERLKTYRS